MSQEISSRRLALCRIGIAAASVLEALNLLPLCSAMFGDPHALRIPYLDWWPAPPEGLPWLPFTVWIGGALALAIGWQTRLAALATLAGHGWVFFADWQNYSNHGYLLLLVVLLLCMAESGATWSVDARRGGGNPRVERWPADLMTVQLSIVYGFAALSKWQTDWLTGDILAAVTRGSPTVPRGLFEGPLGPILALSVLLLEAYLCLAPWTRIGRRTALAAGVALHGGILLALPEADLAVFALACLSIYTLFAGAPSGEGAVTAS